MIKLRQLLLIGLVVLLGCKKDVESTEGQVVFGIDVKDFNNGRIAISDEATEMIISSS